MRNFQKIKALEDYHSLDAPEPVNIHLDSINPARDIHMVLRMLVKPKYGDFKIPDELNYLKEVILKFQQYDRLRTGIDESWCYVTVRHGIVSSVTDDEWHFDGSSFRTDIIPERNYIWVDHTPTEYKVGELEFPINFDPIIHNLFTFAANRLKHKPVSACEAKQWYLLSPFCLHRRPRIESSNAGMSRTFYRICFTDIEGRDINNTNNPLIPTPFYGRNPVQTFRNKLIDYDQVNG